VLHALRYEFIRLRTLRSTWLLIGAALALQALVAGVYGGHADMTPLARFVSSFAGLPLLLVALCVTAIGVASFGHEYRYRTIATAMLTVRSRTRLLAAKALTVTAYAAGTGVGLIAVTLVVEAVRGGTPGNLARIGQVLAAVVVFCVLSALVGLGVAAVTRNSTFALITVLGFPTVVEATLLIGTDIDPRLMPFQSARQLVTPHGGNVWLMPLPLLAVTTALLVASGVLLARRDA
jgi:ABC-2 type transport system permease protein